ncbi:cytochrome-c peroxidase [bacterium]|nr:cytochrome-c peroxidase [bacterium]
MGRYLGIIAIFSIIFWSSCGPDGSNVLDNVDYNPHYVSLTINHPAFPEVPVNEDNPLTEEGIALGRQLYYDPLMHPTGLHACATCHQQEHSFSSDPTVMPHVNLAFDQVYLWKGDVSGQLEDIMKFEVEEFFATDVARLQATDYYPRMFKQAFGIEKIETKYVAYALAQFVKTLNSYNSKYDQYLRKETKLSLEERRGEIIFFSEIGDCFHCHGAPLFKDNLMHNNGLDDNYPNEVDKGHYLLSGRLEDMGVFKTPTLRNIALTAPYMHDGRFATLEDVVMFYSYGVHNVSNVDPLMKQAHRGGIALEENDIAALVAFLNTLTDSSFVQNPEFGRPVR